MVPVAQRDLTPDLLDANEFSWAFVAVETVDFAKNLLVRTLATLGLVVG